MRRKKLVALLFCALTSLSYAQKFEIIPLGVYGGGDESNLSSYLAGIEGSDQYIALDAGTIRSGINKSIENETFQTTMSNVLQNYIKGYFITHGHLDHLSGLIINSPEDSPKPIYALPFVIDIFKNNYFTNPSWANFANEGDQPAIGKYTYTSVTPFQKFPIQETAMTAEVFELSHVSPQKSSAVLLQHNDEYLLYFGDTGADRIEQSNRLEKIWEYIAPLIIAKNLRTIMIEVSFPNEQAETKLFGHLTPKLLQEELGKLATFTGEEALENLNIVITHLKPEENNIKQIKKQLTQDNKFRLHYIFPEQGVKIRLH